MAIILEFYKYLGRSMNVVVAFEHFKIVHKDSGYTSQQIANMFKVAL